jgi:hypothetical protein
MATQRGNAAGGSTQVVIDLTQVDGTAGHGHAFKTLLSFAQFSFPLAI